MKITWPQVGALLIVIIPVTILIGIGRDTADFMSWLAIIVPTVFAGGAYSAAQAANKNAAAARHNTNGRMTQLIEVLREKGADIPAGYEDVTPEADQG